MRKKITALTILLMGFTACSAPEPTWKSSFTEDELREAMFKESKSSVTCSHAQFAGDKEQEVRAQCAADMETMWQGFEFELIECTPDVPQYSGLSGPDLRSAEVCLMQYKNIENPASARMHAQAEAEGRSVIGGRHIPSQVRRSWIVYRLDGQPKLHKYLN